jgi:hypothetical protein
MRSEGSRTARVRPWLLLALALAACSPSAGQPPSAGSTPAATSTTSLPSSTAAAPSSTGQDADVVVGEADDGRHVLMRPGQRLAVQLEADFRPVERSVDGVLAPVAAAGGYPTGQPSTTVLTATGTGEVTLSSSTDDACLHDAPPCAVPQRAWALAVTVAAG